MLPKSFQNQMQTMLQDTYPSFLASYQEKSHNGILVNTLKCNSNFIKNSLNLHEMVPWSSDGFYYDGDIAGKHPFYYAGLYYIQEPSAMLPAEVLPIEKNDRVLDLCAAPGGKSSKLAIKLAGTGFLLANDISFSRAIPLAKNMNRMGFTNVLVSAETDDNLAKTLPDFFDKILVDAPCSGEGMFRKDPSLVKSYLNSGPEYYSAIQIKILRNAIKMLKNDGYLLYSTCTFSKLEDEEVIRKILAENTDLELVPLPLYPGFYDTAYGLKLFPHRIKGEGHFISLLHKKGKNKKELFDYHDFYFKEDDLKLVLPAGKLFKRNNIVFYQPVSVNKDLSNLRMVSSGLKLGEYKNDRFNIEPALATALKSFPIELNLKLNDPSLYTYLKGATLLNKYHLKNGIALVLVEGFPLGFVKVENNILKNKYPKGWLIR